MNSQAFLWHLYEGSICPEAASGGVWCLPGLIGIWAALVAPMGMYEIARKIVGSINLQYGYGPATYTYGLYINLLAYVAIIGASIWDVILKRRENKPTLATVQSINSWRGVHQT